MMLLYATETPTRYAARERYVTRDTAAPRGMPRREYRHARAPARYEPLPMSV